MIMKLWEGLRLLWVTALLLIAPSAWAIAPVAVDGMGRESITLTPHVEVLEDKDGMLGIDDFRDESVPHRFSAASVKGDALGYGYSASAYWLRFQLSNEGTTDSDRILEIAYALLAEVDVYAGFPDGIQHWRGGYATGFQTSEPGRFMAFRMRVPAGEKVWVYLRVKTPNSMNLPLRLWTPQGYQAHAVQDVALQATYFGMVVVIVVYNFLLLLSLRDVNYFLYLIFAVNVALALANFSGIGPSYLWGEAPHWTKVGVNVPGALASVAMLLLTQHMLETRHRSTLMHAALWGLIVANAVLGMLLLGWFERFNPLFVTVSMMTSVVILIAGLQAAWQGQRGAYFFVVAFASLFLANILTHLRNFGILPTNLLTRDGIQIGSIIEMLLLSLALAERFNVTRKEKILAQRKAIEAQEALVRGLKESERTLEAKVKERTELLEISNQKLEALTLTDPLTGVANRRHFEKVFHEECRRAVRMGQPLVVGMVDVDWFKNYNDRYGHTAGDACLRKVATAMKQCLRRPGDFLARYGGEEFVFITPATEVAKGLKQASLLIERVSALGIDHEASPLGHVTVSIGIVCTMPGDRFEELVDMADVALYHAKSEGRNRVGLAEVAPFQRKDDLWS